ncbi:MAG: PilZ domain-containing protein [Spirochaetes bacterium]|nr:PilZ domain-containing protein [Spirochaetota bacterium]
MLKNDKRSNNRHNCAGDYFYSTHSAGNRLDCVLKNISATGACIRTNASLKNNESVILHICRGKDMSFNGKVVWQENDTFGIVFDMNNSEEFENISFILNNITILQ